MGLCPIWNGEITGNQRDQYETMAYSLLEGHLYMDVEVSDELLAMDNPYDTEARESAHISWRGDHAFYNGHYYMYFGIVPVIILFLPYLVITGTSLTTYHATQIFTVFIILGFFVFFDFLRKRFFPTMSRAVYVIVSTGCAMASVWYFVTAPALYCTAISSAVCMMIWAFYFYFKAVFEDVTFNKKIIYAVFGALFGALSVGCRPPVAICNLVFIPLFVIFLQTNEITKKDIKKIIAIFLPYIIIVGLIMIYNYVRFDSPFEFGQRYQLTLTDQHEYTFFSNIGGIRLLNGINTMFFTSEGLDGEFPYVNFGGILPEFPIFAIGIGGLLLSKSVREKLRANKLLAMANMVLVTLIIITMFEVSMAPDINERYHSDVYFILAILTFIVIGFMNTELSGGAKSISSIVFVCFGLLTMVVSVLMFFIPNDSNYIAVNPVYLDYIRSIMYQVEHIM